jgi:hypothetical protein
MNRARTPFREATPRWRSTSLLLGVAVVVALFAAGPAAAATRTVCASGCQFTTIQAALAASNDGDTILVSPGVYAGGLTVSKHIRLVGAGRSNTVIQGGSPVIETTNVVTIVGVTIRGGTDVGIENRGRLELNDSTVRDNVGVTALLGGGILNSGTATINRSEIINNTADAATDDTGGGIANTGVLTLNQSVVSRNNAQVGAGIWNGGTLTVNNSRIAQNFNSFGAGCAIEAGTDNGISRATIKGSTISDNPLAGVCALVSELLVQDSLVTGNKTGILNQAGSVTVINSTLSGNVGRGFSAIDISFLFPTSTILNSLIVGNTDGGVFTEEDIEIENTTITRNTTSGSGGGVLAAFATLKHSRVTNNHAGITGGGISGGYVLIDTVVRENTPNNCAPVPC